MKYEEAILNIMKSLTDEDSKNLVELKKDSITDLCKAKAEVQAWWMCINTKGKMEVLFNVDKSQALVSDYSWLESKKRKVLAGIFIIRQKDEDYLPN